MGNVFSKHEIDLCEKIDTTLKQISIETHGNCDVCKKENMLGYSITSLDLDTKKFICFSCYKK